MSFQFEEQNIPGVFVIKPQVFGDNRGYFMETYKKEIFETYGICGEFVQDNESCSTKGVLRGLHFQKEHTQGKLVRVTSGSVFDVAVDVRPGSATFGQYVGVTLSSELKNMFWVPPGFAHGFLSLSDEMKMMYICDGAYDKDSDTGILYDDKTIGIKWPVDDISKTIHSERDLKLMTFDEFDKLNIFRNF